MITPETPLQTAPHLGGYEVMLRPDGRLAITFRKADSGVEAVLAAGRQGGGVIRDLGTQDPDLEDVFLSLTYSAPEGELEAGTL